MYPNLFLYNICVALLDTNLINLRHESKCVNGRLPKARMGGLSALHWRLLWGGKNEIRVNRRLISIHRTLAAARARIKHLLNVSC